MTGVELLRRLHVERPELRLLVSSGTNRPSAATMQDLRQAGVVKMLHKPYTAEVVLNAVAAALNGGAQL
jgi:DNA-binding NarL/FixJ family response regulator